MAKWLPSGGIEVTVLDNLTTGPSEAGQCESTGKSEDLIHSLYRHHDSPLAAAAPPVRSVRPADGTSAGPLA